MINIFIGKTNETYERYIFNKRLQESDESIYIYVTALRNLEKTCTFCECLHDSLIRDQIVMGVRDNAIRKRLLQERKLILNTCIDICRSTEATASQLKAMSCPSQCDVNKVKSKHRKRKRTRNLRSLKLSRKKLVVHFVAICMFLTSSSAQHGVNRVHYVKEEIILLRNVINLVKPVLYKNLIARVTQTWNG